MSKKYGLLILSPELNVRKFDHKDELETAMESLCEKEIGFIAVKWHDGIKQYVQPEVHEYFEGSLG